jgi:hypothetical protein
MIALSDILIKDKLNLKSVPMGEKGLRRDCDGGNSLPQTVRKGGYFITDLMLCGEENMGDPY